VKLRPDPFAPCPCWSGFAWGDCHGREDSQFSDDDASILAQLQARMIARKRSESRYGNTFRPIRLGPPFNRILMGIDTVPDRGWKNVHAMLSDLLVDDLKSEWLRRQSMLPPTAQHPVATWYPHAVGEIDPFRGAYVAWLRLAYDLFLARRASNIRNVLIKRLRDPSTFQAARAELSAAATMIIAGFKVEFVDERIGQNQKPEFIATRNDGFRLAVEAKSRHRDGVYGFVSENAVRSPDTVSIGAILAKAMKKQTRDPLVVFVDLNLPATYPQLSAIKEIRTSWEYTQRFNSNAACVLFCNDTLFWDLNVSPCVGESWATAMSAASPTGFNAPAEELALAMRRRSQIPFDFLDGSPYK
jgi:hypothetical protein